MAALTMSCSTGSLKGLMLPAPPSIRFRAYTRPEQTWPGRADTLDRIVNGLGLDACVDVGVEASCHPDVKARTWTDRSPDEHWPILHKEIMTLEGPLTAAVRITEDWPYGNDIPLNSDWNLSRFVKPWLESMEDVERHRYVHLPPSDGAIARAQEHFAAQKKVADEYGVITLAGCGMRLTPALQLFGA